MPAIEIRNLTKRYGSSIGIENLTLDITEGEVLGFLGPNGSGKSTTIRTLLGLIKATSGSATFFGRDVLNGDPGMRREVGYLPGSPSYFNSYHARDFLELIASIRGVDCSARIEALSGGLHLNLNQKIGELSKGNRQKVALVQAFMHNPKIILLDEPTSGLDPIVQQEFEEILAEAKSSGAAILLSSHVMSEVEHLADRVAIIKRGQLLLCESIENLQANTVRKIDLHFETPVDVTTLRAIPSITELSMRDNIVSCSIVGSERELLRIAVELGVVRVQTFETSLEDIFMEKVGRS